VCIGAGIQDETGTMTDQTAQRDGHGVDVPVAIVTGGGSGIGRECARMLSEAGYRLALAGRREEALEETIAHLGVGCPEAMAVATDLTDDDTVRRLVDRVMERFGRIDAIVNNAGWTKLGPAHTLDGETVRAIFDVNAIGPTLLVAKALPKMLEAGGGVVVGVSSMSTFDPFPGLGVYGAAKAAMNALALGLTNEYGKKGIRAYAVAPGAVDTALLRSMWSEKVLPKAKTLEPRAVAEVIVSCVLGEREEESGSTIQVPSH